MIETDYPFACPYCSASQCVRLDATGGKKQIFVYDCEICCRPIDIQVIFDSDEIVDFTASGEA